MSSLRRLSFFILGCLLVIGVQASIQRDNHEVMHRRHLHNRAPSAVTAGTGSALSRRSSTKRCKARSTSAPSPTSSPAEASPTSSPSTSGSSGSGSSDSSSSSGSGSSGSSENASGLIKVSSSQCGNIGATKDVTATSGPNGAIDWINCGINDGGWRPPKVSINDLVTVDLSWSFSQGNSPFKACGDFISKFEQYGGQFGIPPIMLAAFAMQESSCNPNTVGGAGEQGLMQLTKDKCGDAPNGDCKDIDYNIRTGAKYFSDTLNSNGGDVFLTIGQYNGWSAGMTYGSATAAANGGCCRCQNNLDYVFQWVNGWILGVDSYSHSPPLGKYFNLNVC